MTSDRKRSRKKYINKLLEIKEARLLEIETKEAYMRLINSRSFRRNPNTVWLLKYDAFVRQMGKAPFVKARVDKLDGAVSYTAITCQWRRHHG